MLKSKKAQVIAMTFSNIAQFIFVLLIMLGLVVAGGIMFSSKGFSKNSIALEKENAKILENLENEKILINFLESPLSDNVKVRDKIIEFALNENYKITDSDLNKMKDILNNLIPENYFVLTLKGINEEPILTFSQNREHKSSGFGTVGESSASVFLFSDKEIKVSLGIYK